MKNKILIMLCFLGLQFFGQTILSVDTLVKTGPINKRINLVIMGDGYTTAQMPQFVTNATTLANYLLNATPFFNYKKYFNVFAIQCPSPQSGVSHPGNATDVTEPASPLVSVTNNFNTKFDCYGTHRSIYSMNGSAVFSVAAAGFPAYDQIVILGNSTVYGGTGGPYAVSSLNSSSPEIVVHEMGHSFANLGDEYWAGPGFANERANRTANNSTATVKWSQWLGTNNTGIFPYDTMAPANQWYRPHNSCKMRFLNSPFCSVCRQTIIEKIHSLTTPIDAYSPDNSGVVTNTTAVEWFKTTLVKPNPNTLKRTWTVNSTVVANNVDSVGLPGATFSLGINTVQFTVMDTTVFSRDTAHAGLHSYSVVWNVYFSTVGIRQIKAQLEFAMFPNPASDIINLNYTLLEDADISISVIDMGGRTVMRDRIGKSAAGEYKKTIRVSELREGNYILALKVNNQVINNKFIIFK
ncbi:MAG: M64 family metallopeptidase [Bacteroidota bacterium]